MKYIFLIVLLLASGCGKKPELSDYNGNFYQYVKALNEYTGVNYDVFMNAVRRGDCDLVKNALEKGYRPPIPPSGCTALHEAVGIGKEEVVLMLIPYFDVNAKTNQGMTALHFACLSLTSNAKIIKLLIESGADSGIEDMFGNTALHYAVQNGYDDRVEVLEAYSRQ